MNNMIYNILAAVIGILLLGAAITDIRRKQIGRGFILALLIVCLIAALFKENFGVLDAFGGMTIGLCAIGISIISHEQIGRGDGPVIAALGLVLGTYSCLAVVSVAAFIMCVAAIIILILKKGNKSTRLPFLPAVFAGYTLCAII